jgi:hypothetical protein
MAVFGTMSFTIVSIDTAIHTFDRASDAPLRGRATPETKTEGSLRDATELDDRQVL